MMERKKLELELQKVRTARLELEYRILERQDEIEKLKSHIDTQEKREVEINETLKKNGVK